jgi:hypothetical protein
VTSQLLDFLDDKRIRKIIALALFYAGLSLAYSLMGFIQPSASGPAEYTPSRLLVEISGHFIFGLLASLPLLDLQLSLLTGALAVLIDSDHILATLGFAVTGRPDHSILYAIVSLVALVYVAKKLGLDNSTLIKIAFIAPITLLAHISYDVFAGPGPGFPLLVPFDFSVYLLPYYFSYVLEIAASLLSIVAYFVSRKYGTRKAQNLETPGKEPLLDGTQSKL